MVKIPKGITIKEFFENSGICQKCGCKLKGSTDE